MIVQLFATAYLAMAVDPSAMDFVPPAIDEDVQFLERRLGFSLAPTEILMARCPWSDEVFEGEDVYCLRSARLPKAAHDHYVGELLKAGWHYDVGPDEPAAQQPYSIFCKGKDRVSLTQYYVGHGAERVLSGLTENDEDVLNYIASSLPFLLSFDEHSPRECPQ